MTLTGTPGKPLSAFAVNTIATTVIGGVVMFLLAWMWAANGHLSAIDQRFSDHEKLFDEMRSSIAREGAIEARLGSLEGAVTAQNAALLSAVKSIETSFDAGRAERMNYQAEMTKRVDELMRETTSRAPSASPK